MGKTEVLNTIDEQIDILTEIIHSKDLQEHFLESSLRYNDIAGIQQMEPISFEEIQEITDQF